MTSTHHAGAAPPVPVRSGLRKRHLSAMGAAIGTVSGFLAPPILAQIGVAAGLLLFLVPIFLIVVDRLKSGNQINVIGQIPEILGNDPTPCLVTKKGGGIIHANPRAEAIFGPAAETHVTAALSGYIAAPNDLVFSLSRYALQNGTAARTVNQRNRSIHIAVNRLRRERLLWRIDVQDSAGAFPDCGLSLPSFDIDPDGIVVAVSTALKEIVKDRESELLKLASSDQLSSGTVQNIETPEGQRSVVVDVREIDGGARRVILLPLNRARGDVDGDMLDALPIAALRLAADGTVLHANDLAVSALEIATGENVRFGELVEGLGRTMGDWVRETAEGRLPMRPELLRATRPREDTYVQATLAAFNDNGAPAVLAVLSDATELKTLEAQFVQSQKMQAIGQLAGGIAHDFNNLLTAISGYCDLLLLRRDRSDPDFADIEQISQNANRAASLVGQLLAYSRKQNLRAQLLDLRDTMAEHAHLLNRLVGEPITLTFNHDPDAKLVRADKRQLEQVIMNIVLNARDSMPDGGLIEIETRATTLAENLVRDNAVVPAGEYVVIRIRDEGSGISPDILSRIFEPFFTTKRAGEGTGLGLSTAYGIVKQSGGFIFADSSSGQGTCFSIYLPAQDPSYVSHVMPEASDKREKATREYGTILLVEDEAPVRAFASRALRLRGHSVIEAANAEDALELLEDTDLNVDVFVTDVIMPGMDGPSWVAEALRERPETRVVFISGYAQENFAEGQARIPHSVLLSKPFSLTQLTDTVQEQLS